MTNAKSESKDHLAIRYPVSIKAIIVVDDKVPLLRNERDEWELPGGKLDPGEQPESCVVREVKEELALNATVCTIIDSWVYNIHGKTDVLIVTYHLDAMSLKGIRVSHEHKELKIFSVNEIEALKMPKGYKQSIRRVIDWRELPASGRGNVL